MPIEQHLLAGEHALANHGKFYLTEKRLLRYKGRGQVLFLPLDRITTVVPKRVYIIPAIVLGGVLICAGFIAKAVAIMADSMSAQLGVILGGQQAATNYSAVVDPILIVLMVAGIFSIGAGIAFSRVWYQVKAPGLTGEDVKTWRIPHANTGEFRYFVQLLQARIVETSGGEAKSQAPSAPQTNSTSPAP
ncbi:MAG: hypothetical protein QMD00_02640 [Hadesarchaea archaeon]|nr:hypothetical protein [Hadesarchaea archaeon]